MSASVLTCDVCKRPMGRGGVDVVDTFEQPKEQPGGFLWRSISWAYLCCSLACGVRIIRLIVVWENADK